MTLLRGEGKAHGHTHAHIAKVRHGGEVTSSHEDMQIYITTASKVTVNTSRVGQLIDNVHKPGVFCKYVVLRRLKFLFSNMIQLQPKDKLIIWSLET